MIEYCLTFSKEEAAKIAAKADEAGVIDDLEYLESKVREWINTDDGARWSHTEK